MDLQNLPPKPRTDADYDKYFYAFSNAVTEKNDELINVIISKEGILDRYFTDNRETLLHVVAQRGTVATAAEMCKLGVNVNSPNKYGETPIFHAIKHSTEMVNLLLNNGASLDLPYTESFKPLEYALLYGTEKIVQIIINKTFAKHFNPKLQSIKVENSEEIIRVLLDHTSLLRPSQYFSPLLTFFAAKIGNLDLFRKTFDDYRNILQPRRSVKPIPKEINHPGLYGYTALHYAVALQVPEVVRFLLNEGADVNIKNEWTLTPLHLAGFFEDEEICKILLSYGAHVNPVLNEYFCTSPLQIVCGGNDSAKLNSLYAFAYNEMSDCFGRSLISCEPYYYNKRKPIFNLGIMKLLLQHGADPNFADYDIGMTPLLNACKAGRLEPIKLLLEFGSNIRFCDIYGNSALHYAVFGDHFEVVDFLLQKGLDIEMKNKRGFTPLLYRLMEGPEICVDTVEYLADSGANINAVLFELCTALRSTVFAYHPDNVECLLELGVNFDVGSTLRFQYFQPKTKILFAFSALKNDIFGDYIRNNYLNEGNNGSLTGNMKEKFQFYDTCKLEIKQLKCTQILKNRRLSFHDFLIRDIYSALRMIKNKRVRKVFACEEYKMQFPCYAYLLKKRFERLELLEKTIDDVVQFLCGYKQFNLTIPIVETILSFLSSSDFRNFGRALLIKRA